MDHKYRIQGDRPASARMAGGCSPLCPRDCRQLQRRSTMLCFLRKSQGSEKQVQRNRFRETNQGNRMKICCAATYTRHWIPAYAGMTWPRDCTSRYTAQRIRHFPATPVNSKTSFPRRRESRPHNSLARITVARVRNVSFDCPGAPSHGR